MTEVPDFERLLMLAKRGDEAAEKAIFQYISERFHLLARHRVGDADAAGDIVQEVCTIIFKKYKTETFSKGFEAWAYGVLRMKIRNYFHKLTESQDKYRSGPMADSTTPGRSYTIGPELEVQLGRCLRKIVAVKPQYARVLNLIYQGYRTEEICSRLKIRRNHLYVVLNRARAMLRACLERGEV